MFEIHHGRKTYTLVDVEMFNLLPKMYADGEHPITLDELVHDCGQITPKSPPSKFFVLQRINRLAEKLEQNGEPVRVARTRMNGPKPIYFALVKAEDVESFGE